jgi:hypothetical protein
LVAPIVELDAPIVELDAPVAEEPEEDLVEVTPVADALVEATPEPVAEAVEFEAPLVTEVARVDEGPVNEDEETVVLLAEDIVEMPDIGALGPFLNGKQNCGKE